MVTLSRHKPAAMSSATPQEGRGRGSNLAPDRYKPFSSQAHYQQVMMALRKLRESGFYWGAVGGREASSLLRSEAPGTFLVRDSSDHHHFFTLSVQTARGTKNLRIHSERGGFFLQPDPHSVRQPPQFDCVLKLIVGGAAAAAAAAAAAKVALELRRPLSSSLSSLQHLCRRTLNNRRGGGLGGSAGRGEQLPHTLRGFLEEYDAPI
uniref:Suppressor of cytokine signaling 3 n=1 Tax=Gadus morhua TaxID=8049 RepID=A0A8C5AX85_GADMO